MGIYSDTLEFNRENSPIDLCMFVHKSRHAVDYYAPLWHRYCEVDSQSLQRKRDKAFSAQAQKLHNMSDNEKIYISFHYLLDICLYREKQLLSLSREHKFITHIVNDAINEYLSIVRESWRHAASQIESARHQLTRLPSYTFEVDDEAEKDVPIVTLLDSLFHYLSATADFDDSQFLQAVFIDISQLVSLVNTNTNGKKPKEVCREYYERTFHPTFGIARCENCGKPLYAECPYCFNCFERS